MKALADSSASTGLSEPHLLFSLGGSVFAIAASAVREIHTLPEVTGLVEAPRGVAGIVNVRGSVVPVLDLQVNFGMAAANAVIDRTLIVLEATVEGRRFLFGIIADEVSSVASIGVREISSAALLAAGAAHGARALVSYVANLPQGLVMVLLPEVLASVCEGVSPPEAALPAGQESSEPLALPFTAGLATLSEAERIVLHERALELLRPVETPDLTHLVPVALVELQDEQFGIDLDGIREFCDIRNVTPVPCCPPHVLGQMNLRGEILTLVDIRAILGMPSAGAAPLKRVVVIEEGDLRLGIPVSDVLDVLYLQPEQVTALPAATKGGSGGLKATAIHQKNVVGILDLSRILNEGSLLVEQEA